MLWASTIAWFGTRADENKTAGKKEKGSEWQRY
jgi:hypothetical protein